MIISKIPSKWATRIKLTCISLVCGFGLLQIILSFVTPTLTENEPIIFFSNDLNDDVELVLHRYLTNAKEISYSLYSLTDPYIQKRFKEKRAKGRIHKNTVGLMHQKILCLDTKCFIGTMNMTPSSIQRDKNIIVGIDSPFLAQRLQIAIQTNQFPAKLMTNIQNQQIELSCLPQDTNSLDTLIQRITHASKSILVAMYHLSHPLICKALLAAFHRGVRVHLFLHAKTKQALDLGNLGLDVHFYQKPHLMHLKWMMIDERILFVGSTNWTKKAFSQNEECHLWLYPLNQKQRKLLLTIWQELAH